MRFGFWFQVLLQTHLKPKTKPRRGVRSAVILAKVLEAAREEHVLIERYGKPAAVRALRKLDVSTAKRIQGVLALPAVS